MSWLYPIPKVAHERVVAAIRDAEARTKGEIRVVVARHKTSDPVSAAQVYFKKFGMAKAQDRNGIRSGEFTDGIVHGVERAGELLAQTFPR
jgi:uncharacterized membrane protein